MNFYIKEWANKTATLMMEDGTILWTFSCVNEARQVCEEWYLLHGKNGQDYNCYTTEDPPCSACAVG